MRKINDSDITLIKNFFRSYADFGVPLIIEPNSPQSKTKAESAKTKISIADSVKKHQQRLNMKYPIRIEEQQNKENENPLKDAEDEKIPVIINDDNESKIPQNIEEETANVLYARANKRLEPEGESRDTEDESDRPLVVKNVNANGLLRMIERTETDRLYNYANIGIPYVDEKENEYLYKVPKSIAIKDGFEKIENPEDLYAAINKSGLPKLTEYSIPCNEQWKEIEVQKNVST